MLQAVSEMLKEGIDYKLEEHKTQVKCAKIILDKIVEGLNTKPPPDLSSKVNWSYAPTSYEQIEKDYPKPEPTLEPVPVKKKEKIPEGKYKIVKNANNRLVRIDGLPLDAMVELDGKAMTHEQARGKEFISGRIL